MALSFWIPLRPITSTVEPVGPCRDGNIIWEIAAYQATNTVVNGIVAKDWAPSTAYNVNDIVNISSVSPLSPDRFSLRCVETVNSYLMPYSLEQELHQAIIDIADELHGLNLGPSKEKYQLLTQYGTDVMNKFIDIKTLSDQSLRALIEENGYKYITDLLTFNTTQLQNIVYYLPLISALKGTLPGLELLLSTFCDQVTIQEEWEDETGSMPAYTFNISLIRLKDVELRSDMQQAIADFCSEYVYPLVTNITVHVMFSDASTNYCFATCKITNRILIRLDEDPLNDYFIETIDSDTGLIPSYRVTYDEVEED